jgi:hypothetical protein
MRCLIVLLAVFAIGLATGCAASTNAADGGADLYAGKCDGKMLFSSCSSQCGFNVCAIGAASCVASQWKCDCSQAVPCANAGDGGNRD